MVGICLRVDGCLSRILDSVVVSAPCDMKEWCVLWMVLDLMTYDDNHMVFVRMK